MADIEEHVLGTHRTDDISGIEIPDRFFAFLQSGDALSLDEVFSHHVQDIFTLVILLQRIEEILSMPFVKHFVDRYQLGHHLILMGRREGVDVLKALVTAPSSYESYETRERAGLLLGRVLRREGDVLGALDVWESLNEMGSVLGAVELAKFLEHNNRDYDRAVSVVEHAISVEETGKRTPLSAELRHRLQRLKRKIARG